MLPVHPSAKPCLARPSEPGSPVQFKGPGLGEPFSVLINKNQVMSRSFIDVFGYTPNIMLVSRNAYERLEKALDLVSWLAVGVLGAFGLKEAYCRKFTQALRKEFNLPEPAAEAFLEKPTRLIDRLLKMFTGSGRKSPLQIPFEWLDAARMGPHNTQHFTMIAENLGIAPQRLDDLLVKAPDFAKKVLKGKRNLMLIDLLVMAFAGQAYFWGKNWVTEKLSGRKGFSGEFKYAQNQYLDHKTDRHERSKKLRQMLSMITGFGAALALPFAVSGILKTQNPSKWMAALKKTVPFFNYSDAISTGKWVLLWHYLFNYDLTSILSSRDKDEAREHITKCAVSDFFYFIGDEVLSGAGALYLQNKLKNTLETPIADRVQTGFLKRLTRALPLHEVYNAVGGNTQSLAYKKARMNSWMGLIGTTACMLVVVPLLNNWYTRRKVTGEQKELEQQKSLEFQGVPLAYRPDFEAFFQGVQHQRQSRQQIPFSGFNPRNSRNFASKQVNA